LQPRDPAGKVHFFSVGLYNLSLKVRSIRNELVFRRSVISLAGVHKYTNNRYWSSQNPHLLHEILLHPVQVDVWCALSARRIVGPVFLTKQIIAKDMYRAFSDNSLQSWQKKKDPATAHTARMYVYAGFVRYLPEQNYQQWYLASPFTLS
jgi:hypothetical protein